MTPSTLLSTPLASSPHQGGGQTDRVSVTAAKGIRLSTPYEFGVSVGHGQRHNAAAVCPLRHPLHGGRTTNTTKEDQLFRCLSLAFGFCTRWHSSCQGTVGKHQNLLSIAHLLRLRQFQTSSHRINASREPSQNHFPDTPITRTGHAPPSFSPSRPSIEVQDR